ncbi:HesA/MoeB/ThiF family protein [Loktanella salsilacus]|uniref:HesA/MoeB/ThiF family protein n=1 Tax=Loktanella salsilacus TaxID=195913 RepID=UPI0020B771DB|nr:HesA/MoeB/ThiF family protein [Loktanella salsilacus]UTH48848.1 HesA/MoeB/ThiF family protein [Loktanella salsilacus]
MSRYIRQEILPQVGPAGQAAISAARVLVIGAGGLAAPVLQYLVGAGIGHLTLVDPDTVSLSNLHRQTLFRMDDIGQPKVDAAAATLRQLNDDCRIDTVQAALDPANAAALIAAHTLVLDCADSFAACYILSDACLVAGVPLISASTLGFTGYVGGFCAGAPSLRAIFPDLPDRAASCATAGVMGPVVGLIGAAQAQMALAVLIGQTPSPLGQMLQFDLASFRASGFRFDTAPEPEAGFRFIAPAQIGPADVVIDLRDTQEAPSPVIPTALRMTNAQIADQTFPDTGRIVFACRSGLRAWQAASTLRTKRGGEISLIACGDTPEI